MRNKGKGRGAVGGAKKVRKALLVPAALIVTVISSACGDDEPQLIPCPDVPETGTCQPCINVKGSGQKACAGAPGCAWVEESGMCEKFAA